MSIQADFRVGIVGTGFAGLVAALHLKKKGIESFVMFERAAEIGGTWRDNVYPGCACDVASQLYSFEGEPNPNWSRRYSPQPEILAYMKGVVAKYSLQQHIRFNADIVEALFLEERGCWLVTNRRGNTTTVQVLLLGLGPLNRPSLPQIPGLEEYRGHHFHSSEWDSSYDLKGKRVAVIGTGASAIQIVPNIAPQVAKLYVFQRTPAWVAHRFDSRISEGVKELYRRFPALLRLRRKMIYQLNEWFGLGLIGNERMNRLMAWISLRKLAKEVADPEIRRKLTPNYKIGCKRILRSDDYYPAFNRPNVHLITEPIERFTVQGLITRDGAAHELDAIIFATGFVAADINVYAKIIGRHNRMLPDEWNSQGAEAYRGTTVSGFPNLGFILGPNTGLGHNSVLLMMEAQMKYLVQYIVYLSASGEGSFLDVKKEEQQAYNQRIQQQFRGTVWSSGCKSWYMNAKGRNTTLYPRLVTDFRKEMETFDPKAYQLVQPPITKEKNSVNT